MRMGCEPGEFCPFCAERFDCICDDDRRGGFDDADYHDYAGAFDGVANVVSDADPGL